MDLFVLIATYMDTPLRSVTKYMAILQGINQNKGTIKLLSISYLIPLISDPIHIRIMENLLPTFPMNNTSNFCNCCHLKCPLLSRTQLLNKLQSLQVYVYPPLCIMNSIQ